ncbi:MAG: hypothetical protein A3J80_05015 [Desulfobacula sp. RIFOXYB2_FULL_45_6]|nr:MAG: hypothetical protein A3J80_05015 [Desulfobacula sp. RIFOXYB2_FULL_45_6]
MDTPILKANSFKGYLFLHPVVPFVSSCQEWQQPLFLRYGAGLIPGMWREFQKSANLAYEHHRKYAKNFGLTREFDPAISKIELLENLRIYSEGWERLFIQHS